MKTILMAGLTAGALDISVMQHVVLPLSAVAKRPFSLSTTLVMVAIHIACVGLPISLMVRRYSTA